ncbi:MAG: hypothetical protein OEW64_03725 [Gammaproteobacteria bacterium]|nr:hypothetical protein [Gammaproteobacteria bacterium]MDH5303187.1 hypothetical protein [Gammaproteobacteria bacterium]MDH5320805.1 hypothetical protein [Gammaproteobacteria bacterium]
MKLTTKIVISCLLAVSTSTSLACDYPERPSIPDGNTASKDELLAAKEAVNAYLAGVDSYLTCIEDAEKAAVAELENPDPADLQRRDEMLSKKFDAANDEKVLVGEQFNQQVRAYNAARQAGN